VISVVSRSISADSASRLWRAERTAGLARAEAAKARKAKMAAFILLLCTLLCCFLVGEGERSQEARGLENRRKEDSCCLLLLSAAVCCWRKERKRREGLGGLKATYLCSSSLPLCHCVSPDTRRRPTLPPIFFAILNALSHCEQMPIVKENVLHREPWFPRLPNGAKTCLSRPTIYGEETMMSTGIVFGLVDEVVDAAQSVYSVLFVCRGSWLSRCCHQSGNISCRSFAASSRCPRKPD